MAPRTRSQGIRPLPFLPIELKREILSFCDPPSLANASLVSLAFVELASPFLYQDITIKEFEQLNRLFYGDKRPSTAPHLDSFLSLSQTRTFTFNDHPDDGDWQGYFSRTRLPHSSPLRIHTLEVRYDHEVALPPLPTTHLLNLVDPVIACFSSTVGTEGSKAWISLEKLGWTRLVHLSLWDVIPYRYISTCPFVRLLPPSSLTVILHPFLFSPNSSGSVFTELMSEFLGQEWLEQPTDNQRALWNCNRVREVVLRTRDEDQKKMCRDTMQEFWDAASLTASERARREGMVRVEVMDFEPIREIPK